MVFIASVRSFPRWVFDQVVCLRSRSNCAKVIAPMRSSNDASNASRCP